MVSSGNLVGISHDGNGFSLYSVRIRPLLIAWPTMILRMRPVAVAEAVLRLAGIMFIRVAVRMVCASWMFPIPQIRVKPVSVMIIV